MENLYREHILDHFRHPHNEGTLKDADVSWELDNPVCGDLVRFEAEGRTSERVTVQGSWLCDLYGVGIDVDRSSPG